MQDYRLRIGVVGLWISLLGGSGIPPAMAVTGFPIAGLAQATKQPLPPESVKQPTAPLKFGLADGTAIKLRFVGAVSSKTAKPNDLIQFEVVEAVKVGDKIVIAPGAPARGIVTAAQSAGMLGRKGKLDIALQEVTLVSGERITLRGNESAGGGNSASTLALSAVISPFFLLMSGKNINYDNTTQFTA